MKFEIPEVEYFFSIDNSSYRPHNLLKQTLFRFRMMRKKEERLKIHVSADESETDPDEEETPEQRGEYFCLIYLSKLNCSSSVISEVVFSSV